MCYLKIPKDCYVRQYTETAFGYDGTYCPNTDHYVFSLFGTEYDGYTFTVTDSFGRFGEVQKSGDWYSVYVSSDDLPITVRRTENRESGKRYKQFKITPNELNKMYGNEFEHAAAFIKIYANNNRRTAGEVIETKYIVGIVDGCWLISDELKKRRRIDTNGVELLCTFSTSYVGDVEKIIKAHKEKIREIGHRRSEVYSALHALERVKWEFNHKSKLPEIEAITDAAVKAEQSLKARLDELNAELIHLDAELRVELEKYSKKAV